MRRYAALRSGRRGGSPLLAAGIVVTVLLALARDVGAGGDPVLVLPLSRALALIDARSAAPAPHERRAAPDVASEVVLAWRKSPTGTPAPPTFIPKRFQIPDLYRVDRERDPPRFAAPVDNDRLVALPLLAPTGHRPSISFKLEGESLPIPLGDSSHRLGLELELPF